MIDSMLLDRTGVAFEDAIILPPPNRNDAAGELRLGEISYCGKKLFPFGLRKEELIRHVGLFGQTGSGKTTACMNLLREFVKAGIPFSDLRLEEKLAATFYRIQTFRTKTS